MSKSKSQARLLLVDDAKESVQVNAVWKVRDKRRVIVYSSELCSLDTCAVKFS